MESPQQHQHGGESIVLHTFYTGRAKISTKTFERGVQPEKNCSNIGTQPVNDKPRDPTQPRQMETSPEAGQSILVQPLAGAEPLYSPPQRTAAHGAAPRYGSAGERPVGGDEEQVAGLERCLAEKFPDDARQSPEVGGGHDAYDLVLKNIAAVADAVNDGQRLLPLGLREPRSDIFAVSRRGKNKIMIIFSLCRPQPARFLPQLFDRLPK